MHQQLTERPVDLDPRETEEWIEALDQIVDAAGPDRANFLLEKLTDRARDIGVEIPLRTTTDYINTIPADRQVPFPVDRALERRIGNIVAGSGGVTIEGDVSPVREGSVVLFPQEKVDMLQNNGQTGMKVVRFFAPAANPDNYKFYENIGFPP